jgi:hypothetical protein
MLCIGSLEPFQPMAEVQAADGESFRGSWQLRRELTHRRPRWFCSGPFSTTLLTLGQGTR